MMNEDGMMNKRVYRVTEEDLDYWETLEPSDVGRFYILVNGCIQFVEEKDVIKLCYHVTMKEWE